MSAAAEKVTSIGVLFAVALTGENPTDKLDGAFKDEKTAVSVNADEVS